MTSNTQSKSLVFVSLVCFSLAGCALNSSGPAATNIAGGGVSGRAYGGQQPVTGSRVTLYAVGTADYGSDATMLGPTVQTDSHGNFQFAAGSYTCPQANTPVYLVARGGDPGGGNNASLVEAAGIGACGASGNVTVQINEISTAVTAAAMGQFFTTALGTSSTDSFGGPSSGTLPNVVYSKGLTAANANTVPTLLDLPAGIPQASTANISVDDAKLRTIANILASCVNSQGATSTTETTSACGALFSLTNATGSATRPSDTLQAAVMMARYPSYNVSQLISRVPAAVPFSGGVTGTLNDFTVAVKYSNPSMALTVNPGTQTNLDIDAAGNIWLPSTAPAGVAMFNPATRTYTPYLNGMGLTHPQNVAVGTNNYVHLADAGSGVLSQIQTNGTTPTSVNTGGTSVGAVQMGPADQIWLSYASLTGNKLAEMPAGLLQTIFTNVLLGTTTNYATSLAVLPNNDVYSATSNGKAGYLEKYNASQVVQSLITPSIAASYGNIGSGQVTHSGTTLAATAPLTSNLCTAASCPITPVAGLSTPQSSATDGAGNLWTTNSGNASVLTTQGSAGNFAAIAVYKHDAANGGQLVTPYGIAIDASGNVWMSNATATGQPYVLTEIVGTAAPTITPLAGQISGGTNLIGTKPTN